MHAAQGLFRTAQQKKPAEFLSRAFTGDKDRAAAAKNAFVLLAQHRPQMAAAFFILGETFQDLYSSGLECKARSKLWLASTVGLTPGSHPVR